MKITQDIVENAKNCCSKSIESLVDSINQTTQHIINKMIGTNPFLHIQSDDIKQDVSIKILTKLHQYEPTHSFESWVAQIAKNHILDIIRKNKRVNVSSTNEIDVQEPESTHADDCILLNEIINHSKLTAFQLEVLQLLYIREMSYDEIAETTNSPLGTIKVTIHRLKKELKISSRKFERV